MRLLMGNVGLFGMNKGLLFWLLLGGIEERRLGEVGEEIKKNVS